MNLRPSETILVGQWLLRGERLVTDDVCEGIAELTKSHLVQVGQDVSGWQILYRDPNDGRLWELTYPQGEMQGGGPPLLKHVAPEYAWQNYGVQAVKS